MSAGLGGLGEVLVTVRPGEDTLDNPASGEDLVGDLIDDFKGDRGDVCNAVGSVDPPRRGNGAMSTHSASVRSLPYRRGSPLCRRRLVGVPMRSSKRASITI